jgi:serine/threonine protein kinase
VLSTSNGRALVVSAEASPDLQDRLARFARAGFFLAGAMFVASIVADLVLGIAVAKNLEKPYRIVTLIHRDIKPANVILTERPDEPDVVKVVDFGLVRTIGHDAGDLTASSTNAVVGTPTYIAPEGITAPERIDARADLYALGGVAYFLITGQHVFTGSTRSTPLEVCSKHLSETPESPSRRLGRPIEPDLEALILSCLSKRREDRPASAVAFRNALLACADAARYDADAARAWWKERGDVLRRREAPVSASTSTMANRSPRSRGATCGAGGAWAPLLSPSARDALKTRRTEDASHGRRAARKMRRTEALGSTGVHVP